VINAEHALYIGGRWIEPEEGFAEVCDPARLEVIGKAPMASTAQVDKAVTAAREAFETGPWPRLTRLERADLLSRVADALAGAADEGLVEMESANTGAPMRLATMLHVGGPVTHALHFAELARRPLDSALAPESVPYLGASTILREPDGVCAGIAPSNYPLLGAVWKTFPALAAGCTVVVKAHELTWLTTGVLATLFDEAGFPPGVVNFLSGPGPTVGAALAAHPGVDHVSLTGSVTVGRSIMAAAAATVKKLTLELGGKSPNILLPDADLDLAVEGSLWAAFGHGGQMCTAGTRLLVPRGLRDEVIERLCAGAATLRVGDPADWSTDMGPLISAAAIEKVERYVELAAAEGATVAHGGRRAEAGLPGHFYEPTVLAGVDNRSRVAQEEIFGPVVSVIEYADVDEAVRLANDCDLGLAAGVWSKDPERAWDVARRIRAGTVWINDWNMIPADAPFGGYKQSGLGRELGLNGILEYTQVKHVYMALAARERRLYGVVVPS
jgi:aldehyde dehydrogenase (NAD+)